MQRLITRVWQSHVSSEVCAGVLRVVKNLSVGTEHVVIQQMFHLTEKQKDVNYPVLLSP